MCLKGKKELKFDNKNTIKIKRNTQKRKLDFFLKKVGVCGGKRVIIVYADEFFMGDFNDELPCFRALTC